MNYSDIHNNVFRGNSLVRNDTCTENEGSNYDYVISSYCGNKFGEWLYPPV